MVVLNERHQIEMDLERIQLDTQMGLNILEQLKKEIQVLKDHEADININKDFTYTVHEERVAKVALPPGTHTTTCMRCNRTCHNDCPYSDNEDKARCPVMDGNGYCTVCPGCCHWQMHKNLPYMYEIERVAVTKTAAELQARYEDAKGKKLSSTHLIKQMVDQFEKIKVQVIENTKKLADKGGIEDPFAKYENELREAKKATR